MDAFEDTIQEVHDHKSQATGDAPALAETPSSETPALTPEPESTADLTPVETPAGGADESAKDPGEAKTTPEDFNLTGLETPEDLTVKHGEGWMSKTARKHLSLVKEAGGSHNLRHGTQLINDIHNGASGPEILQRISGISPERATAIRRDILWDAVDMKGIKGADGQTTFDMIDFILRDQLPEFPDLTLDFVREAVANELSYSTPAATADDDDDVESSLPASVQKKLDHYDQLMAKVPELEKQVTGYTTERQTERQQAQERQVQELGQKLYGTVFGVVEERKSKLGLDISPQDSPRIRGIKRSLAYHLSQENLEEAFTRDPDNLRISNLAMAQIGSLNERGAFEYADTLTVGAENTWRSVIESPEVSDLLASLKSEMESQSLPKNPSARTEYVQGAPAGMSAADPWDEGAKEGKSPFDVSVALAGRGTARV